MSDTTTTDDARALEADELAARRRAREAASEAEAEAAQRPSILIGHDELRVNDEGEAALARLGTVYQRAGRLVHVVREAPEAGGKVRREGACARIVPLEAATLRELLSVAADWRRPDGPGHAPSWTVQALLARGTWRGVPVLEGVSDVPVLRADGGIAEAPGHDPASGILIEPRGPRMPPLAQAPSQADAAAAAEALLDDLASDFPFCEPAHRSGFLAALLTPLARQAFAGNSPLFLLDASTRGSGKSLLADVIALLASGCPAAKSPLGRNDEETRKLLTSMIVAGDAVVTFDNVTGRLGGAPLEAVLTCEGRWRDRLLGSNDLSPDVPVRTTWLATANNAEVSADMSRRVLPIRLRPEVEHPEDRQPSEFRHADLRAHVREHRGRLLGLALTVLRSYFVAGQPAVPMRPWGSFEAWSRVVRGAVIHAGLPDPREACMEFRDAADTESAARAALLAGIEALDPRGDGLRAAEILRALTDAPEEHAELREALEELAPARKGPGLPSSAALGRILRASRDRIIGGRVLRARKERGGIARWRVEHP